MVAQLPRAPLPPAMKPAVEYFMFFFVLDRFILYTPVWCHCGVTVLKYGVLYGVCVRVRCRGRRRTCGVNYVKLTCPLPLLYVSASRRAIIVHLKKMGAGGV